MIEATAASIVFVVLAAFVIGILIGWLLTEADFKTRKENRHD